MIKTSIGSYITNNYGGIIASFTAAATGDNTEVTTENLDRLNYESCVITLGYNVALTTAKKLTNILSIQDSSDGSTWTDAVVLNALHDVATATSKGTYEYNINLNSYKRYVRFITKLDLTHSGTDTCTAYTNITFGGAKNLPI